MKEIKRLVRCERGHFYDAGKYDVCPHCENTMEIGVTRYEPEWEAAQDAIAQKKTPPAGVYTPPQVPDDYEVQAHVSEPDDFKGPSSRPQEKDMTVQFYQKTLGTEPVVGWVVCTDGVHLGQDFRLKSGRNFVGRSGTMDICLSGDSAVSRDRHLIISYDPKGNMFFVQSGDTSSALSYLNDKPLLEVATLKTGDKLNVGETELRFVAFCGKGFSWE